MPGFSSTQNSGPSSGGLSNSSMIPTALVAKSGSRSFIQVSKTVQAQLVALEDDANGALAGRAQAQLGVCGDILRQVLDAPVRLARARGVDLGWLLAGQHQQPGLDLGIVLARRRALWPIPGARPPPLGGGAPPP